MIPFEVFTMLGSAVLGGVMKMMHAKQQNNHLLLEAAIKKGSINEKSVVSARSFVPDGGKWTRRMIVAVVILAVFLAPTVGPMLFGEIHINYLYQEDSASFFSYDKLKVVTLTGITILPVFTHSAMSILGFYFGSRIGK